MLGRAVFLLSMTLIAVYSEATQEPVPFVIDQSMPYVYIKFDHVGKRTPLSEGESLKGYWLRLVNNCRVPLSLHIFDGGRDNPGVGVYDEVVPASSAGISYVDASGISHGDSMPPPRPPKGYAQDEVTSSTQLAPGQNLLFSVPINHVSEHWHLRVEFQLDPNKKVSPELQPRSSVDFTWAMIPEKDRAVGHR